MAYGEEFSDAERERIVRGVYLHFCKMIMELLHTPRKIHLTNWREHVSLVGHEPTLDRLMTGGPIILLTGHYGNWELAGYLFGLFGFPTYSVARTLDNPYLDRFLRTFRERTGQKLIPKAGGYDQILEVLQSGRALSMLADQDAGQRGMFVEFFGRPASTHKAIALLAIEHQAPVVVGVTRRIGPGFRYEIRSADVIEPAEFSGTAADAWLLTQRYSTALETLIRQDPTQYLWLHRRWKHQPQQRKAGSRRQAVGIEIVDRS
jgi:KDO2-lipid IV(A) lauroyltransferase